MQLNSELYSLVNFEFKFTLTILDECEQAEQAINLFYDTLPYRISNHNIVRLKLNKRDLIDKIPTRYLDDFTNIYDHFLLEIPTRERLLTFYSQFDNTDIYWVTKERFPKKRKTNFEDFCALVKETHPENLDHRIMPYTCLGNNFITLNTTNINSIIKKFKTETKNEFATTIQADTIKAF